jgi:hypothetical protein
MGFGVQSPAQENPQPRLKISPPPRASPVQIEYERLRLPLRLAVANGQIRQFCAVRPMRRS